MPDVTPACRRDGGPLLDLEARVQLALQRYSNVHRGAGQHAQASTRLYERAREIVLDYFGVDRRSHCAIFGNRRVLSNIHPSGVPNEPTLQVFSNDLGLPLGIGALVVRKKALHRGFPAERGGGTVRLVSRKYVVWKDAPERFEAGTPNILGAVALGVALQRIKKHGNADLFREPIGTDSEPKHPEKPAARVLGQNAKVPTRGGLATYVNFDTAASTPSFRSVWEAARRTMRQSEVELRKVPKRVETLCSEFFGAPPNKYEILFVSNATEGINIVAQSSRQLRGTGRGVRRTVVVSGLEHNSNELAWRHQPGTAVVRLPVDDEGFISERTLESTLRVCNLKRRAGTGGVGLVAVSGCSNVTGSMNDLARVSEIVHRYGASLLVDAAQLAAHRRIDMNVVGIDFLVCSGHKMYAPYGTGVLIVRKGLLTFGARELTKIRISGRENAVGIAALGKAIEILSKVGMETVRRREGELIRRALAGLRQIPGVQLFGVSDLDSERLEKRGPVVAFRLRDVHHNLAAKLLAEAGGIGVRSGCFCAHLFVKQIMGISVLQSFGSNVAMLLAPARFESALPGIVRVSFSFIHTEQQIDHFLRVLSDVASAPAPPLGRFFARLYYGTPVVPVTHEQRRIDQWIAGLERDVYDAV